MAPRPRIDGTPPTHAVLLLQVTNDTMLGALYSLVVTPFPMPGSIWLTPSNTAITDIKQGPPQSVNVALGRRRLLQLDSPGSGDWTRWLPCLPSWIPAACLNAREGIDCRQVSTGGNETSFGSLSTCSLPGCSPALAR